MPGDHGVPTTEATGRPVAPLPTFVIEGRLLFDSPCGLSFTAYRHCPFRCAFCVTNAQGRAEPQVPDADFDRALAAELDQLAPGAFIGVGSIVDAYPPAEETFGLTRRALAVMVERRHRIVIVTRSPLVERDLDLLVTGDVQVNVSLSTLDPDRQRALEPGSVTDPEARLQMLERLRAAGVDASLMLEPWIPDVSDVGAVLDRLGPEVPITVGPLAVSFPGSERHPFVRDLDQDEINARYLDELARVGDRPNLGWRNVIAGTTADFQYVAMGDTYRDTVFRRCPDPFA